jgi:hypothetical protein
MEMTEEVWEALDYTAAVAVGIADENAEVGGFAVVVEVGSLFAVAIMVAAVTIELVVVLDSIAVVVAAEAEVAC